MHLVAEEVLGEHGDGGVDAALAPRVQAVERQVRGHHLRYLSNQRRLITSFCSEQLSVTTTKMNGPFLPPRIHRFF